MASSLFQDMAIIADSRLPALIWVNMAKAAPQLIDINARRGETSFHAHQPETEKGITSLGNLCVVMFVTALLTAACLPYPDPPSLKGAPR